jgi:hypothetical protein
MMPSEDDRFEGKELYITTFTRKMFHLHGTDPDEICLEDMAHATSNLCRYTGHVREFYSVAEHEVLVADVVKVLGGTVEEQLIGAFHDTTEAYLSDIAAPWKPHLENYHKLEHQIWKRIAAKYSLPLFMPPIIKKADWLALFIEARFLINDDYKHWVGYEEHGEESIRIGDMPEITIWGWEPKTARIQWLRKLRELWDKPRGKLE